MWGSIFGQHEPQDGCECQSCEYARYLERQQQKHATAVFDAVSERWAGDVCIQTVAQGPVVPGLLGGRAAQRQVMPAIIKSEAIKERVREVPNN